MAVISPPDFEEDRALITGTPWLEEHPEHYFWLGADADEQRLGLGYFIEYRGPDLYRDILKWQ